MKLLAALLATFSTTLALAQTTPAVVNFRTCAAPVYPKSALRHERTGTVKLKFLVGTDGKVKESVIENTSGHEDLDQAAKDALERCAFKPGLKDGVPQESWTTVQYVWSLGDSTRLGRVDFASCALPVYPAAALAEKRSGTVMLRYMVDVAGTAGDKEVTRSSGSSDLDQAALEAISHCKFKPTTKNGSPVAGWVPVNYIWSLPK